MAAPPVPVWEAYADAVIDAALVDVVSVQGSTDPVTVAVRERLGGVDKKTRARVAKQLEAAERDLHAALHEPATGFAYLAWNAGLDDVGVCVLAVLCSVEVDEIRQRLVQVIADSTHRGVTLGVVLRLFGPPGVAVVTGDGALARACLVDPAEPVGPWSGHVTHLAPSIAGLIAGAAHRDPDLPEDAELIWETEVDEEGHGFVLVTGGDRLSRRLVAMRRCAGSRFVVTPLPANEPQRRAVVRHCVAYGTSAILESDRDLDGPSRRWIDDSPISFALCSPSQLRLDHLPQRPFFEYDVGDQDAVVAGTGHHLDAEQRRLAMTALASVGGDFDAAVRRVATGHLDALAVRTKPGRSWDELVLPDDKVRQLQELVQRYRYRATVYHEWGFAARPSTGVTALFAGPSGTGKTMTAEIVATDLGLDLYRIDLSAVVSKYIGETEKNLESLFTASSAGNLVLFFDEADALFGKRTEVNDARDRYANIETSYLLQRLERYEGVVILATNLRNNIDQAFLRRVDLSVDFELPNEQHRRRIWQVVFPHGAPLDGVDVDVLAHEFEMTGGAIRNAAVHAAFLAAAEDGAISMDHVLTGVQREFQKEGRLRSQTDETVAAIRGGMHVSAAR